VIPITTQDYLTNALANLTISQLSDLQNQLNDMGTNNLTNIVGVLGTILAPELSRYRFTKYPSIDILVYLGFKQKIDIN